MISRTTAAALIAMLGTGGTALAADHTNLDEGLGTSVADAYPVPFLGRELQLVTRFERDAEGKEKMFYEPRIEVGILPNTQLTLKVPVEQEGFDHVALAETTVEALYNFNQEGLALPAFAVSGGVEMPTGPETEGFDPFVRVIVTKTIPGTRQWQRVHLNAQWLFNTARGPEERSGSYDLVAGYDYRISTALLAIVAIVREQGREDALTANLGEVGVRYQLNPLWTLSAALGAGASDEGRGLVRGVLAVQVLPF